MSGLFFFTSRRRHTRFDCDWSSDVCSSDLFLDSIACLSETHCFALSDPIDGKFLLLRTTDSEHWNPLPSGNMPAALPREGAFAASNTGLALSGEEIFVGTGGPAARVFRCPDTGPTRPVAGRAIAHNAASSG